MDKDIPIMWLTQKGAKCYLKKEEIELYCIHPSTHYIIISHCNIIHVRYKPCVMTT